MLFFAERIEGAIESRRRLYFSQITGLRCSGSVASHTAAEILMYAFGTSLFRSHLLRLNGGELPGSMEELQSAFAKMNADITRRITPAIRDYTRQPGKYGLPRHHVPETRRLAKRALQRTFG